VSNSLAAILPEAPLRLILAFLIFFAAGGVKGVLGFGMPTVAMALFGFMMTPQRAAVLLIVPSLLTNTWQIFAGPPVGPAAKRSWPLLVTIAIGTALGITVLGTRLGGGATVLLGFVLAIYGVVGLASARLRVPTGVRSWLTPVIGITTGLLNAATGVSVIPLVPYLHSLDLGKEDLVQTLGLCFLVAIVALGAGLTLTLHLRLSVLDVILPIAASLAGMGSGQALRRRISAETFRRWFLVALILVGIYLAVHAA
jgi:uncharacterized protein